MFTRGRKDALIDSIIEMAINKNVDISSNSLLLIGIRKLNEKELSELEEFISKLV